MPYVQPCGCSFYAYMEGGPRITFCPLHAAAQQMLVALDLLVDFKCLWTKEFVDKHGVGITSKQVYGEARAAIAAARGVPDGS